MARSYIPVYFDLLQEAQELTDQEFGRMIRAAIMYASGLPNYMDCIQGNERFVFRFLVGQIDRNNAISDARAKAGASKREQEKANTNKPKQTTTKRNKKSDENPLFNRFWEEYPRHENKQAAMREFEKAKVDDGLLTTLLAAIRRQKESAQWTENNGQFIPYPATWLKGKRWEDEVRNVQKPKAGQYNQRDYSSVNDGLMAQQDQEMEEFLNGGGR